MGPADDRLPRPRRRDVRLRPHRPSHRRGVRERWLDHYTYDANGNTLSIVTSLAATAVEGSAAPLEFALGPTTPNPGSGPRSMAFTIPSRGHVTLRVFDVSGREVATLYNRALDPRRYNAQFSTDRWGNGVYFYRLGMAGRMRSGRLVVLR